MNHIVPIKAFKDNYIWVIHNAQSEIIVVDPGDPQVVLDYLSQHHLHLQAILLTHHHHDHSGGIVELCRHFPDLLVYGPAAEPVRGVNHRLQENASIHFPSFQLTFQILAIPGHTRGHIAYFAPHILFCGDTLFSCGCGRLFEGTAAQMYHSLEKLKKLPLDTRIYCGHEYTRQNILFAQSMEPHNPLLQRRLSMVEHLLKQGLPSLPVLLADELAINPFLRCDQASQMGLSLEPIAAFAYLRHLKDNFNVN